MTDLNNHQAWIEKKQKHISYILALKDAEYKGIYTGTLYRSIEGSMRTEFFGTATMQWRTSNVGLDVIKKGVGKYYEDLKIFKRDYLPNGKWQELNDNDFQRFCNYVKSEFESEQYKDKGYTRKYTDVLFDCWKNFKPTA